MTALKKLFGDFLGLARVLGVGYAVRWMIAIGVHFRDVLVTRNLQRPDRAMGAGPFHVFMRPYGARFSILGDEAFSGIREMYVRDAYLRNGTLGIEDGDVVLDLGGNMGNFTNLALAHGARVRVIAVEPNRSLNESFRRSVGLNAGFLDRVTLIRAFLGVSEIDVRQPDSPETEGAPIMMESDLVNAAAIDHVDFLKCDIEGGEFNLLHPGSALLRMSRNLAIEVHSFAGDVEKFIKMIDDCGFTVKHVKQDPDGTATVLAARR